MNPLSLISYLFWFSFVLLTLAYLSALFYPRPFRFLLGGGILLQFILLIIRGWLIGFFPLTNKFESFYAFSLCVFLVLLYRSTGRGGVTPPLQMITSPADNKAYRGILMFVGWAFLLASCFFSQKISYAPPLMFTIWYVFHVPLSFLAYALWASAAAAAAAGWRKNSGAQNFVSLRKVRDDDALYGFILWSVSMIFGGIWGYVAWGSYFLWDPKVVWSVVLWFFYAAYIHLDAWPEMEKRKNLLAILGLAAVLITYVGTSFFAKSSHSF